MAWRKQGRSPKFKASANHSGLPNFPAKAQMPTKAQHPLSGEFPYCGCDGIYFCPLHKLAPEMREALHEIITRNWLPDHSPLRTRIVELLAQTAETAQLLS